MAYENRKLKFHEGAKEKKFSDGKLEIWQTWNTVLLSI